MFKWIVIGSSLLAACASALFVPLDPATLRLLGLTSEQGTGSFGQHGPTQTEPQRLKIVSGASGTQSSPYQRMDIKIVRAPRPEPLSNANELQVASARDDIRARMTFANGPLVMPVAQADARPNRLSIARNLQSELRRIGCYRGRIDGDWGPASRYAMARFTKAVNAVLPTNEPDMVLLALVRRHAGTTCGSKSIEPARTIEARAEPTPSTGWKTQVAHALVRKASPQPPLQKSVAGLVAPPRLVSSSYERPRVVSPRRSAQPAYAQIKVRPTIVGTGQPRTTKQSSSSYVAQAAPNTNGAMFARDPNRMSLGAPIAPQRARVQQPVTSAPAAATIRRSRKTTRRTYVPRRVIKSRKRTQRSRYRRRSRNAWRKRVYSGINANGS